MKTTYANVKHPDRLGWILDQFDLAGGIDVVFDNHAVPLAILVDQGKPFLDPFIELDVPAEGDKGIPRERDSFLTSLVNHQLHVGEDAKRFSEQLTLTLKF